jgi:hypothetical protein
MTTKNRLAKLEKHSGVSEKKNYICFTGLGFLESSEEKAKGYRVQPCPLEYGGTGEKPFYIATRKELEEFAARSDVHLDLIEFVYADTPTA